MKKRVLNIINLFVISFCMVSCLEHDLDSLPAYDMAEIEDFDFEYRWVQKDTIKSDGKVIDIRDQVHVETLDASFDVDTNTNVISTTVSPSGNFPNFVIETISLKKLWGYAKISIASSIDPVGDSPVLGKPQDYSNGAKYKVTAANGQVKEWTLDVKYEAKYSYKSSGTFDHPSGGLRSFNLGKVFSVVGDNEFQTAHSDLGQHGYKIKIKLNSDNSVVVTQTDANGNEIGEMVPGLDNSYDSNNKTYTLNYRYMGSGGYRVVSEKLVYSK
jgi:hypothetical protein